MLSTTYPNVEISKEGKSYRVNIDRVKPAWNIADRVLTPTEMTWDTITEQETNATQNNIDNSPPPTTLASPPSLPSPSCSSHDSLCYSPPLLAKSSRGRALKPTDFYY